MKKVLSAKEMVLGCLPTDKGLVRCKYGKINKYIAYELGIEREYSYGVRPMRLTVVEFKKGKLFVKETKTFRDETEELGGRIVGKYYKNANELASEYLQKLKDEYKIS